MTGQSLYHTYQRYRTLRTDRITALPILILMPHSACNCKCVMCDIWKDNKRVRQLTQEDIRPLLVSMKKLGTKQILMSGGEALMHAGFFDLCSLLREQDLRISLHSTGLLLKKHADRLLESVDDIIISLDGTPSVHDSIRNLPGAFALLREGVQLLKSKDPSFRITARSVIHKQNFRSWPGLIECAKEMGLDQVSFLPADTGSQAFNREITWDEQRQDEVAISRDELGELKSILDEIIIHSAGDFEDHFIAESPAKLMNIYHYYRALHGEGTFPYKKCNAPWVSAVIEPDGAVRPCFFHERIGNIRTQSLTEILNGAEGMKFRKELDMETNETCKRCVCFLNLPAGMNPASKS